ncbi:MAG: cobalamin-dependent protein [Anaerolineales bacterium]|nr:cobalamin-dependent protein [Anaerolineales bacterium]
MSEKLINTIAEMQEEEALALAKELLASGTPPSTILDDCRSAMEIVGKRFEEGQYFIAELILAGEMVKAISTEVKPHLKISQATQKGSKVVVGTVKGDIHDIGKDIVVFMLDVNGFEVYDLGIDVPPQTFVDKIKEVKPVVVGLSGFLTLSFESMKETVAAIKAAGQRDSVKIMVGGGTVDERVCEYAEADAFGIDAMTAVSLAKGWTK